MGLQDTRDKSELWRGSPRMTSRTIAMAMATLVLFISFSADLDGIKGFSRIVQSSNIQEYPEYNQLLTRNFLLLMPDTGPQAGE